MVNNYRSVVGKSDTKNRNIKNNTIKDISTKKGKIIEVFPY